MKNKTLFILFISSIVFFKCGLLKSEEEVYFRMLITGSRLTLYSDLSFKDETSSDIILHGETESFTSTGIYQKTDDGIILSYDKNNIIDTLYYVYWGKRKFLIDEESIKYIAKYYNENKVDDIELMIYRTNIDTKNKPVYGKPIVPKQFDNYLK